MGFRTILVGFIFIFFNINLGTINILPDVIGYILLFIGSNTLMSNLSNKFFSVVRTSSLILIVLSSLDTLIKHTTLLKDITGNVQTIQGRVFSFLSYFIIGALFTYCLFHLCKGIEEEANKINAEKLSENARSCFIVFAVYELVFFIFFLVSFFSGNHETSLSGGGAIVLFVVAVIIVIYVFVKMFSLLNQAEKAFLR